MAEKITLNVYQRLAAAKKLVAKSTFSKQKGEGLKFAYLPIEQIKPVVEDAMNEAGLIIDFGPLDTYNIREPLEKVSTYSGEKSLWFHMGGTQDFTWVNIDDPTDRLVQTFTGEAKDNSDKCISKLYTAILKNFYKQVFNISTDRKDDPDNTEDEKREEEAARRMKIKETEERAKKDPFFRPIHEKVKEKKLQDEKEKQTEDDTPPAEAPKITDGQDDDVLKDKSPEVKVQTIVHALNDLSTRKIVTDMTTVLGIGLRTDTWAPEQLDEVYRAVVRTMQKRQGAQ